MLLAEEIGPVSKGRTSVASLQVLEVLGDPNGCPGIRVLRALGFPMAEEDPEIAAHFKGYQPRVDPSPV